MLPGMEMLTCPNLAVSPEVMQHIVQVESGANPYAIGVVDGQLVRQPRNMEEALATARMLEGKGYNFSLGIAQVNRANLGRYGLDSYRKAFNTCDNLAAGAQILASCYGSAHGDWGKAFSCYYSGNFTTGFRDGYVQKVYASINRVAKKENAVPAPADQAIPLMPPTATAPISRSNTALQPVVVYASDSAQYRIALRSVAIDTAAAAMTPLVVSAAGHSPHAEAPPPSNAMAQQPSGSAGSRVAGPDTHIPDDPQSPAQDAAVPHSAAASTSPSAGNGVFEPQVRGPNDPPMRPATVAQGAAPSHANGADLRLEQRDAAFVF